jgi:hypothetical protein
MEKDNPDKQPDKYSGVVNFDMELTPSVWICGAAGSVLGVILAMWGTSDIPIIIATAITFGVLSGIQPRRRLGYRTSLGVFTHPFRCVRLRQ